jgi:hypothetical protein
MKITTIPQTTGEEPYASFFTAFLEKGLNVPKPLLLMSASPPLFNVYRQILMHFLSHENLQPRLLACIRYAVAYRSHFAACVETNRDILNLRGVTDLSSLEDEKPLPDMSHEDSQIFVFAMDALFHPERVTRVRIEQLVDSGIPEQILFDAAFHGAMLLMMGPLVASFG